jgi:hypothetical protein
LAITYAQQSVDDKNETPDIIFAAEKYYTNIILPFGKIVGCNTVAEKTRVRRLKTCEPLISLVS